MNHSRFVQTTFWKCIGFLLALPLMGAAQTYTITDLGDLGGSGSGARGINASGQVTGYVATQRGGSSPFLYSDGKMTSLGTLGGGSGIGQAINSSGQVAGYSTLRDGEYRGFISVGGKLRSVGFLACCYSDAEGINDAGQVTGASSTANGDIHPYLYTNGKMMDLGTLPGGSEPGSWNTGEAVNNLGEVVGWGYGDAGFRAILWSKGQIRDLGTLGGPYSEAFGINDQGQITGQAYIPGGIGADAFLYENGVMKDLGTITSPTGSNGQYAYGLGINNDGVVVGESAYQENPTAIVYHAFVYSNGKMKDLNRLIPPNSGWVLSTINDAGQIVGYGTIHNQQRAFLLTPQ